MTPTILALLGLPVADDLPGRPLLELMDPAFVERHPVGRIESYGLRRLRTGDIAESGNNEAFVDRMKGLGYLGGPREEERRRPKR